MHDEAFYFIYRALYENGGMKMRSVVEIGSRNVNGSVRPLFEQIAQNYYGIDLAPGPDVDEVADAVDWRPAERVDCIVCCEVLEHAPDVEGVVRMISESLEKKGVLLMTCATDPRPPHSAYDGGVVRIGEYYQNVAPEIFHDFCSAHDLKILHQEIHLKRGDLYVVAEKTA
ncbi:MAG: methyltransferase domain-containing protein [Pyrinomonadaceae bacterium]